MHEKDIIYCCVWNFSLDSHPPTPRPHCLPLSSHEQRAHRPGFNMLKSGGGGIKNRPSTELLYLMNSMHNKSILVLLRPSTTSRRQLVAMSHPDHEWFKEEEKVDHIASHYQKPEHGELNLLCTPTARPATHMINRCSYAHLFPPSLASLGSARSKLWE